MRARRPGARRMTRASTCCCARPTVRHSLPYVCRKQVRFRTHGSAPSLAVIAMLLVFGGAVFVFFFFPVLAHRTYFSENALLVNAAQPSFNKGDALVALKVRAAGARVPVRLQLHHRSADPYDLRRSRVGAGKAAGMPLAPAGRAGGRSGGRERGCSSHSISGKECGA